MKKLEAIVKTENLPESCWEAGDLPLEEIKFMLALAMVVGIGPAAFRRLMGAFGSAEGVFGAASPELTAACPQLKPESLEGILSGPNLRGVRHQEETCQRLGARIVSHRSAAYPAPLLTLAHPQPFVFMLGDWRAEDRKSIAVVGTRYPSGYGARMARDLTLGMTEAGFTVVSGLARGIDTLAHEAALSAGGRTVAVLGSGLDWIYPNENIPLARRIAAKGCLISEFPMGTAPHATHFPRRNRFISALSLGTLVVEAGNDSGALITAEFAMEQGREVFAVPGAVQNPGSRGPHKLIQDGAHLAETHGDIIRVLQGLSQAVPARRVPVDGDDLPQVGVNNHGHSPGGAAPTMDLQADAGDASATLGASDSHDISATMETATPDGGQGFDGEARELLELIGREAMTLDAISAKARGKAGLKDAPAHRLLTGLLELELKGKVKRMPGALFRRA